MTEQEKQDLLKSMEKIFPHIKTEEQKKKDIIWELCDDAWVWDLFQQVFYPNR